MDHTNKLEEQIYWVMTRIAMPAIGMALIVAIVVLAMLAMADPDLTYPLIRDASTGQLWE